MESGRMICRPVENRENDADDSPEKDAQGVSAAERVSHSFGARYRMGRAICVPRDDLPMTLMLAGHNCRRMHARTSCPSVMFVPGIFAGVMCVRTCTKRLGWKHVSAYVSQK